MLLVITNYLLLTFYDCHPSKITRKKSTRVFFGTENCYVMASQRWQDDEAEQKFNSTIILLYVLPSTPIYTLLYLRYISTYMSHPTAHYMFTLTEVFGFKQARCPVGWSVGSRPVLYGISHVQTLPYPKYFYCPNCLSLLSHSVD